MECSEHCNMDQNIRQLTNVTDVVTMDTKTKSCIRPCLGSLQFTTSSVYAIFHPLRKKKGYLERIEQVVVLWNMFLSCVLSGQSAPT